MKYFHKPLYGTLHPHTAFSNSRLHSRQNDGERPACITQGGCTYIYGCKLSFRSFLQSSERSTNMRAAYHPTGDRAYGTAELSKLPSLHGYSWTDVEVMSTNIDRLVPFNQTTFVKQRWRYQVLQLLANLLTRGDVDNDRRIFTRISRKN